MNMLIKDHLFSSYQQAPHHALASSGAIDPIKADNHQNFCANIDRQ